MISAAVCLAAIVVALPVAFDRIATANLRHHLQAVANQVAVATLLAADLGDEDALRRALAVSGIGDEMLVSSLRRYETGGGRASEVVITQAVRSPIGFLYSGDVATLEVTGRAITWR